MSKKIRSLLNNDIKLEPHELERICKIMYERSGIVLNETKHDMVHSRLSRRLRLHNLTSYTEYLDRLESQPSAREWQSLVNALTTNLTAFFREEHHFPILSDFAKEKGRPIRVWCAAASTGEEPYSIAITLTEALGKTLGRQCEILASDIDTEALAKARAGIYPLNQVLMLPGHYLKSYFLKGGGSQQTYARIKETELPKIEFRHVNLNGPSWGVTGKFDVIFCRNIMIYFDKQSQSRILDRFAQMINPDGILITGHSESFQSVTDKFTLIGKTVYKLTP